MPKRCLYLVSSSASREYVADCLEALALPRGMIMHFRYRLRYVDDDVVNGLPEEGAKLGPDLHNLSVVVVYVCQTQTAGIWAPIEAEDRGGSYLPLRCGRLVHAFKDGVIAHFFFEVTGYVKEDDESSNRKLLNKKVTFRRKDADSKVRTKYAHLSDDLNFDSPLTDDTKAFQSILDNAYWPNEWRTRSLGSAPLDVTYDIVSFRISGLFQKIENRLRLLSPKPQVIGSNVYAAYQLEVGGAYHLRLATHLPYRAPASLPGQGQVALKLEFNADLIQRVGTTRLRLNSFYDLEYWSFLVANGGGQESALKVSCEYNVPVDQSQFQRNEVLCPEISLPIVISSGTPPGQVGIK